VGRVAGERRTRTPDPAALPSPPRGKAMGSEGSGQDPFRNMEALLEYVRRHGNFVSILYTLVLAP
jgi:hypothetical protein